jgi:hypothetical protein
VNSIEIPLTFATAGLVGLGGLAFLMGAALSLVAELLAMLRRHRNWVRSNPRSPGRPVVRSGPGLHRSQADPAVTAVLASWQDDSDPCSQRSELELPGPRAAA